MTNHSSSNAVVVLDPSEGYVHLAEAMGGRVIGLSTGGAVGPSQLGGISAGAASKNAEED